MSLSGDGWFTSATGTTHWGRFGAAGLLLCAPDADGPGWVHLLQHRAAWTAHGGTWGIPGGARDFQESATAAALRETWEECGIDPHAVTVHSTQCTARIPGPRHDDWTYTTVIGVVDNVLPTVANAESADLRWVPTAAVADYRLLPAFAQAWPELQRRIAVMPSPPLVGPQPQ